MPSHDFKKFLTRPVRVQDSEVYNRPIFKFSKARVTEAMMVPNDGKWEGTYREDEFYNFFEYLANKIKAKDWSISKHLKDFDNYSNKLKRSAYRLGIISNKGPYKDFLFYYKEYIKKWDNYVQFIWIPWAITHYLDDWFAQELKKNYEDWEDIYESLAVSSKPIQTQELVEKVLAWKIKKGDMKELEKLAKKYGHLGGYSVNDKYWKEKDLLDQVKQFKNPKKDLGKMKSERLAAKREVKKTLERLRKNRRIYNVAKTIHEYIYLRTERIDVYKESLLAVGPFYRRFEKEFHLPKGWAANLSIDEICIALEKGKLPEMKDMSNRQHHQYVVYVTPKETKVISDPKEQLNFLKSKIKGYGKEKKVSSISGKVSFVGKIKGKARVIIHTKDIPKMKKGEILISNMTHPDYMPAIYKAKGIVTDEGGIVCHAAIISRELKIPCVIGTSDATKIFKTGDIVEVDAEKGIVRKLK